MNKWLIAICAVALATSHGLAIAYGVQLEKNSVLKGRTVVVKDSVIDTQKAEDNIRHAPASDDAPQAPVLRSAIERLRAK